MIRIHRAQISFHGFAHGPQRAAAVSQHALHQVAASAAPASTSSQPRVQLTVHVPHGASDAAIADRVARALRQHLARRPAR